MGGQGLSERGGEAVGVTSAGIRRIPFIESLLGARVVWCAGYGPLDAAVASIAGWGWRPSTRRSRALSRRAGLPFVALEDGFLRSFGPGSRFPPLAIVVDRLGIYYDATRPSQLEVWLNSDEDVLSGRSEEVQRARRLLATHRLSKYNHSPCEGLARLRADGRRRVLVVDQTAGDVSIALGQAHERTFHDMLAAALAENPDATIYVKTHPEVSSGGKRGHFAGPVDHERVVALREALDPVRLIEQMDRIYVVTSTMGFEALLAGKPVTCFGMPWYAGWGVTDDRVNCPRRTRQRSVDELFAAAYLAYSRYLDPVTHRRGTVFDVIDWLVLQKTMADRYSGRMICVAFPRWRAFNLKPMLSLFPRRVAFVSSVAGAAALAPAGADCLIHWGREAPPGLEALALRCGVRLLSMEDGFVRSVGLGSDLIRPLSLVLDERGIYFDPARESDLERLLNTHEFGSTDRTRARAVREFIVAHGITKYNIEPRARADWRADGRPVVLVPGQVEDDASIRFGCEGVRTNLDLLRAARAAHPDAFIVYKPHPDVVSRNRKGTVATGAAAEIADHVETGLSVVSCIEACDVVHTMTSLTGFDALLRGKRVVVYGRPFYAGWGLTEDVLPVPRRQRRLDLDELVAGALLHYPFYWDWDLKGYTTCEAVLRRIVELREALEASGGLAKLRLGYVRRQLRKARVVAKAWLGGGRG